MRQRTIVCPIIQNDGAYLLCKMADDRGVFPGQWALSGGGMEPGETMEQALRREIREELGDALEITEVKPWAFRDDTRVKTYADGTTEEIYMIYLIHAHYLRPKGPSLIAHCPGVLPVHALKTSINALTLL